jgi:hypothetical protein
MRRFVIACAVLACAVATASAASAASLKDVDPHALKDAQCMLAVLKKEPGVHKAKLGVENTLEWVHPYLEYDPPADKNGDQATIHITVPKACPFKGELGACCADDGRNYCFSIFLSGITAVGTRPNDWGTTALYEKWQAACGLHVNIVYN